MAKAASDCLGDRINEGIVITKYGHVKKLFEGDGRMFLSGR